MIGIDGMTPFDFTGTDNNDSYTLLKRAHEYVDTGNGSAPLFLERRLLALRCV